MSKPDISNTSGHPKLSQLGRVLDSRAKVAALYVFSMLILATGLATLDSQYSDNDFASEYLWTEIAVALLFAGVSVMMLRPKQIGLDVPRISRSWRLWAPVVVVALAGASTAMTWASLPDGGSIDSTVWFRTLLTTLLVGFTEEWMYRGLLLVVLTRLLGYRRGVVLAAVAFGLLHGLNIFGGQTLVAVIVQVVLTTFVAFMFTGVALATRSIWIAVILHGLFDFFSISNGLLTEAGGATNPLAGVSVLATVLIAVAVMANVIRSSSRQGTEIY